MYLQRADKLSSKAHIWNSETKDTECTMWSTGGLNQDNDYEFCQNTKRSICSMCVGNYRKRTGRPHDLVKAEAEKYQRLYDFFAQEHGINLTVGQMDDILHEVQQYLKEQL